MDCISIALFQSLKTSKALHILPTHKHIYKAIVEETKQGTCLLIRSSLGFSVLLKGTSTFSLEEPGIDPVTFMF